MSAQPKPDTGLVRVDPSMHMGSTGCGCPHEEWDYRLASIVMHQDEGEAVTTLVMLDEDHEEGLPDAATFSEARKQAMQWIDAARDTGLSVVDCTGVQTGNSDLPVPEWAPTHSTERPPLPVYPLPRDLPVIEPRGK